jgi:hypothetical protein
MADIMIPQYDQLEPEYTEIALEAKPVGIMGPAMIACFGAAGLCFLA